ncbi:MAG: hypothetical protein HY017_06775 [Betaproteobacteria bacterium]|nr:hypothetical protein [Betaproteobacteria bacterium]
MKPRYIALVLAFAAAPLATIADDTRSYPVPGEKLDSGLGSLPHYSRWAQEAVLKTAGAAATRAGTRVNGEKLDSGLGELPHYRDWKDPSGHALTAAAVQRSQFADAKR